ncbi:recombinase family protein [Pseudomonas sp. ZM23]|uniref:Recombinase family protein n=1 Tax=Pseudomonas triclosanedens TaxID=2961893 RepID=A0ABY7A7P6_9PSED|nr:recombinase family protein [Pseudomonas triclosanedens]MCP8467203.1 recombinase family protein [Pseudomonas triclosanedens]MCP8472530.1 recombinase family protein [Pseudomonas triclosanedens]WAI52511.1 recombinase family protein [Pseudomonas triclosanedens]
MNAHLYLRASTDDQDANRAKQSLIAFAQEKEMAVVDVYAENISGTKLERPELFRLLNAAQAGDVLLVESVDRLSRLSQADWETLKGVIKSKGLRLVVQDLGTTHQLVTDKGITGQIMDVINGMLIDLMATMARLDQEKRVERIKQGLENKRQRGEKVGGKGRNQEKWNKVADLLKRNGNTMEEIAKLADVGIATVYRIKKELSEG